RTPLRCRRSRTPPGATAPPPSAHICNKKQDHQEDHMIDASLGHRKPADLPERIRHYIDGEFVDSADGVTFDVLDPVTNETYVQAAAGKKADIDLAVAAAQRA